MSVSALTRALTSLVCLFFLINAVIIISCCQIAHRSAALISAAILLFYSTVRTVYRHLRLPKHARTL